MSRLLRGVFLAIVASGLWGCTALQTDRDEQPPQPAAEAPPQEVAAFHLVEDGRQQLTAGQTETAIATFQKALALAPSSPHANLALAEAKVQRGEFRAAVVYCDRVARLVGDDPAWRWRVALIRARAFEGVGDVSQAAVEFRRVLEDEPGNVEARDGLIRVEGSRVH